ncbi:regulator of chromosome condensation, RCC1 [Myxococcus hansupus]|uniref:Regulator of chromosome condensation, RCC1 n=1 Tax=Pseudomyxococcus hansupus TaxID=1297742 RepID=A0A0H4WQM6_9BACT|nr:regulator of chromosome condensation, RCC1 [Myxococcus hansupus]
MTGEALLEGATDHGGISVSLESTTLTTVTDAEGQFSLEDVTPGTHTVVARRSGYGDVRQSVEVRAGETASVTLELQRSRTELEGSVDLEGSEDVSGVTVSVVESGATTTTDAQGLFRFSGLPAGTYTLEFQKEGYVSAQLTETVEAGDHHFVSVTLLRERGVVTGVLQLEGSDDPSGVLITLVGANASTTTDAQGHFRFEGVPTGTYTVLAQRNLYLDAEQTVEVRANQESAVTLTMSLGRGDVSGTVQLSDGASPEGVTLTLVRSGATTTTDAQGRFSFTNLPQGDDTLRAQKEGYATAEQPVSVRHAAPATLSFTLTRTQGRVAGVIQLEGASDHSGATVTMTASGATATTDAQGRYAFENVPVGTHALVIQRDLYAQVQRSAVVSAGATATVSVTLARLRGNLQGNIRLTGAIQHAGTTVTLDEAGLTSTTDAQGRYTFSNVPTGTYTLTARRNAYTQVQRTVEVRAGVTLSVSFNLEPLYGQLAGTIQLQGASNHAGITVTLDEAGLTSTTNAQGQYAFNNVTPGTYTLTARRNFYAQVQRTVEIQVGVTPAVSFTLEHLYGQLAGVIQLEGGGAPGDILVTLTGTSLSATTDAQGQFSFGRIPAGPYTLNAQKQDFSSVQQAVEVRPDEQTSVDLTLRFARGSIAGTVALDDGAFPSGITVSVAELGRTLTTDGAGRFTLNDLIPGTYSLEFQRAGYLRHEQAVEVRSEQSTSLSVTLRRERGTVEGTVRLEGEALHSGATVFLSGLSGQTTTNDQGRFFFENVPVGTYTVTARRSNYTRAQAQVVVRLNETASADLSLNRLGAPVFTAPKLAVQRGHLRLEGAHFGQERGDVRISIGGVDVQEYLGWSDTEVVVRVPGHLAPGVHELAMVTGVDWRPTVTASLRVLRQRTLAYDTHWGIGVLPDNTVTVWGSTSSFGFSLIPEDLSDVVSVGTGLLFAVALQADGTVVKWGTMDQAPVPAGLRDVVDISAYGTLLLALKSDGTVVRIIREGASEAWNVPEGLQDVVAVSAGYHNALVLKADGTVVIWGGADSGMLDVPEGLNDVVAISLTDSSALALRADGTAAVWGFGASYHNLASTPDLSDVVQIAQGDRHYMALRSNGTVIAWGNNEHGQAAPPANLTDAAAVAGWAWDKSIALRQNGTLATWGTFQSWNRPPAGLVLRVPAR